MKKLLMVCYYFPPLGLAGTQRAVKFARYLPEFGWQPTVLTVKPIAYWAQDPSLLQETAGIDIVRSESWDPQRWLARLRKTPAMPNAGSSRRGLLPWVNEHIAPFFLLPDSKILWKMPALQAVQKMMRHNSFAAVFSTSPPHSAQLIAREIKRRSGLPWIADFRDSWAGSVVVREPTRWHRMANERLQRRVVCEADALIAVTPTIQQQLLQRGARLCEWIPNGFDPADYPLPSRSRSARLVLCHCGTVTEFSRPDSLLQALQLLKKSDPHLAKKLHMRFVGYDALGHLPEWIRACGVEDLVTHSGYLPHRQALQELVDADGLVLIARGRADFAFVPGKAYEYLGSRKPILLLSDVPDTRTLLEPLPNVRFAAPEDVAQIARQIAAWMAAAEAEPVALPELACFERRFQTGQLARLLDRCVQDCSRKTR